MAICPFCKANQGFEAVDLNIPNLGRHITGIQCKSCGALCGVLDNIPIEKLVQQIENYKSEQNRQEMVSKIPKTNPNNNQ